ncbi:hypothetical protein FGIG_00962 [Fasciola gigantica]|uniref:Roundabout 2 n=1 Tax=Fasciola gigantica TaxID=46835 RepID=A0A504YYA9_FASGI|nr:hypothetical protein FGIG_00962 [Fasciola gigantica]
MFRSTIILLQFIWTFGKTVVIENPQSVFGLENQKIVLRCHVHGSGNVSFRWLRGKSVLQTNPPERKITVANQTDGSVISSLTIHLTRNNEGEYHCNATDNDEWIQSQKAEVRIAFLEEQFILEPQEKTVSVGETVLLECRPPKGLPKPSVKWIKDNTTVDVDERTQILENGNLRIDRIIWKDSGAYACVAESFAFHRQSSSANLVVRQRPYFVSSPISQSVPIHSSFELDCSAAGEPLPVIVWRRDPPFLEIPFERTRLLPRGTLQFNRVQLEDAGDYVCRAISSAGIIEAIAQVNVVSPPGLVKTPPHTVFTLEGVRVELPCKALGSPTPDIRWMRHNPETYLVADAGNSVDRVVMTPSGTLLIYATRLDDSSTYECRASSPAGLTRSVTVLTVQPNPNLEPARIGAFSAGRMFLPLATQHKTVRIICEFPSVSFEKDHSRTKHGQPASIRNDKASILWLVNGKSLRTHFPNPNKTHIEHDGSLLINHFDLSDKGNYTCTVFNHVSRRYSTWNFELLVTVNAKDSEVKPLHSTSLPNPPSSLVVTGIGDTWMSFRWTDDTKDYPGVPIYRLYYLPIISGQFSDSNRKHDPLDEATTTGQERISPKLDVWLHTPDIVRNTQTRISSLLPNTGYWIEVRKTNDLGTSSGFIYPKIVYTLRKPNTAMFLDGVSNNGSGFEQRTDRTHSLVNSNTAVDYQEMSTNFQSISFSDIKVRSLTTTEILTSWTTRSTGNILNQIDGFRMNIKPVPMTRCLVTATSGSLDQLSSFPYQDRAKAPLELDGTVSHSDSYMSPVHCSLSSDALIQQIIRMSNTVANYPVSIYETSLRHPESQTVIVGRSVSSVNPTTKAVGGGLHPFTCYEVDVEAFRDDIVYGRMWSRTSRSTLALTLDSSPSYSPHLVNAHWLFDVVGVGNESIPERSGAKLNVVRLAWRPLELRMAHGALIGYVIHFLANDTQQSRTIHVPADAVTRDIFGLSPHVEYTIYLAGVTCRGEGVRGAGFRLPPAISLWRKTHGSKFSELGVITDSSLYFPPWAYGIIAGIVLFWVAIGLLAPLLGRRSTVKHDIVTSFKTRNITGSPDHRGLLSRFSFPSCHWCAWSESIRPNRTIETKTQSSVDDTVDRGPEVEPTYTLSPALSENHVEMTTLLQRAVDVRTLSNSSERTSSECHSRQSDLRRAVLSSGSHSQSIPKLSIGSSKQDFDSSNMLPADNAEVYANSDPSVVSHPNSPSPTNFASTLYSQNNQGIGSLNQPFTKPQLPDSINIPFPLPPNYQTNGVNTVADEPCDTIINRHPICDYISSTYSHGTQAYPNVQDNSHDDAVPPYASCTVLPVSEQSFSGSFVHPLPGSTLHQGSFFVPDAFQAHCSVGAVGMSQSIGGSSGLMQEEPVFVDPRTDRHPATHRWPMHSRAQLATVASSYMGVPNSIHPIPPPPEYPPPPLPTRLSDWMVPNDQQQSSIPQTANGYPSPRTLNREDQTMLYPYRMNGEQMELSSTSPYYASGGIYAQTETNASLSPCNQSNDTSHPSVNTPPNNHPHAVDVNCGTLGLLRHNYQMSSYGFAPSGSEQSQQPFNHRSYRSHSSGLRSGEGSSGDRSTTSGLGSGSTKFANGFGRLPDSSASGVPPVSGSTSGSDSSSGSGARVGPNRQQTTTMVVNSASLSAGVNKRQLLPASTSPPRSQLAIISTNGSHHQLPSSGGHLSITECELKSSISSSCASQPLPHQVSSHSTGSAYPYFPIRTIENEPLVMCNPGVIGPQGSTIGAGISFGRID